MKMSRRARRMERSHQRHRRGAGLNLVSLMDIFTILVFFLLVNASGVQHLSTSKALTLPEARAERPPAETLVVMVSGEEILVQGRRIATLAELEGEQGLLIKPLQAELTYQARRSRPETGDTVRELTIMGDRAIPYRVLKRIMATCTQAGYGTLSLAVTRKAKG